MGYFQWFFENCICSTLTGPFSAVSTRNFENKTIWFANSTRSNRICKKNKLIFFRFFIEIFEDHKSAQSARIRASFGTFFRQSLQMKCTNFGLDRWRFRVQTRFSCRFDFSSPTYVYRVEIVQESKERARRVFFLIFKKCNFWSDWSNFEEVTARPYRGEDVCKSWSELVKISVSYDQNKFSFVFIEKNVHFPVSILSDCSSYNLNFS